MCLFRKTRIVSFKFNFLQFQQLRNKVAKYSYFVFVIVIQWLIQLEKGVQFLTISTNVNNFYLFIYLARPFVNYFVQNISGRDSIHMLDIW